MPRSRSLGPLVTLTTDFGLSDAYVAAMKAAVLRHCPTARVIDVTHLIPRHDVLPGAIELERAIDAFGEKSIHVAVVDPGVGTDRRLLVARVRDQLIICPDNGLITWAWRCHGGGEAFELTWRPTRSSHTFHGRDVMAPVAGMLASGKPLRSLARRIDDPVLLDIAPASPGATQGRIIHIDSFGNATTNIPETHLRDPRTATVTIKRRRIGPVRRTYGDVRSGQPLALIGSSGLLEIAVRNGSAAGMLKLKVGDVVRISDRCP